MHMHGSQTAKFMKVFSLKISRYTVISSLGPFIVFRSYVLKLTAILVLKTTKSALGITVCIPLYAGTSTNITLSGQATVAVYQQALLALTYLNTADEPTKDPPRRVDMQVFDGRFFSNVATGFVNITLVNDNRLMLLCGGGLPMFTEGSTIPLPIASSLTVSDVDADHVLSSATVTLENAQMGDEIQVNDSARGELTVEQSSGVSITITGQAMAAQYQVS